MNLEKRLLSQKNQHLKKELYEKFAEIGIGRTAVIYAQKT